MKPKKDFSEDENYKYLMLKKGDPIKSGQVFPLGYTDKRDKKKKKKRRSKKSLNSSKSGSSESIEEINEEFEDENYDYINKNNSDPGKSGTDMIINDENFKLFPKEEDSDSEIVEEEIITEELIAKIYGDKNEEMLREKNNMELNINTDITPISETLITKENKNTDDINYEEKIIKKEKKKKVLRLKFKENILFKYFNHKSLIAKMRVITLFILLFYIILMLINIFSYGFKKNKLNISCFEFIPSELTEKNSTSIFYQNKLFLSDRISLLFVQFLLIIPFTSIILSLIKNEYLPLKQFFKETSFYFPLSLALNIPIIIIGILKDKYENDDGSLSILFPIIFTLLTIIGFLCMGFILISSKNKKYKSITNLINISILCSFLTAFQLYCVLYSICLIIKSMNSQKTFIAEIVMSSIYFLFGIFMIISFKDIFFVLIVVIIELGLLYIKRNIAVTILNLSTTVFSFISIIINILKYKKKVFGLTHME